MFNRRTSLRLIASIEGALGIMNIKEIATSDPRLEALIVRFCLHLDHFLCETLSFNYLNLISLQPKIIVRIWVRSQSFTIQIWKRNKIFDFWKEWLVLHRERR